MEYFITILIGYLLGIIQTSYFLGLILYKKDIRNLGNGNAGASNATLVFGKKVGLLTVIVDISKAYVGLKIVNYLYPERIDLLFLVGLMVFIGHCYPIYMNFRGGKGTASLIGIALALDYRLGLLVLLIYLLMVLITDYMVMGTMSLLLIVLIYTLYFQLMTFNLVCVSLMIILSVSKHLANFSRIMKHEETHVSSVFKKK